MEPLFFEVDVDGREFHICLVDFREYHTQDDLAELLISRHTRALEHNDMLVLRPDVDRPIQNKRDLLQPEDVLLRRVPRSQVRVLYSHNFKHVLSPDLASSGPEELSRETRERVVKDIRSKEFLHYVNNTDALLSARDGFVYRAPSGHHVRKFLRVGNIQKNRQALDAVFFWMLPHLEGCSAIVVDTWSIGSIALNAARLFERYKRGTHCRVELLPTYFDGRSESLSHANSVLEHALQGDGTILVLFSAVRSGRSLERFREFADCVAPVASTRYLSVFSLTETASIQSLCTYPIGFESIPRKGTVVSIDPSSFFPVAATDTPLLIRKLDADYNRPFFRHYKGSGAIRVHRDIHDSKGMKLRHHAFDIDVISLLNSARFTSRFFEKLQNTPQPFVIIVPAHEAGKKLGEVASRFFAEKWNTAPRLIRHPDLDTRDKTLNDIFSQMDAETEILILDDVSTTGQRLSRYQANLRTRGFRGHISYLVGIARPNNENAWEDRVHNLKPREGGRDNSVEFIERIVLPDWSEEECPWCIEYRWLSNAIRAGSVNVDTLNFALERHSVLQSAADSEGLIKNALWIPNELIRPTLTPGSIFLPHTGATEADVVASVAGAVQRMRTELSEARRLHAVFPNPRILSPDNYLGPSPRFNDTILGMAVLRVALPSELTRWDDEDEAQRLEYLFKVLSSNDASSHLELIVGMSQRKFPFVADYDGRLESILSPEVHAILAATLSHQ